MISCPHCLQLLLYQDPFIAADSQNGILHTSKRDQKNFIGDGNPKTENILEANAMALSQSLSKFRFVRFHRDTQNTFRKKVKVTSTKTKNLNELSFLDYFLC